MLPAYRVNEAESNYRNARLSLHLSPFRGSPFSFIVRRRLVADMSIKPWQSFFPVVVGLVVPAFFLLVYLSSALHRHKSRRAESERAWRRLLAALRDRQRCAEPLVELAHQRLASSDPAVARLKSAQATLEEAIASAERNLASLFLQPGSLSQAEEELNAALSALRDRLGNAGSPSPVDLAPVDRELERTKADLMTATEDFHRALSLDRSARNSGPSS